MLAPQYTLAKNLGFDGGTTAKINDTFGFNFQLGYKTRLTGSVVTCREIQECHATHFVRIVDAYGVDADR